MMTPASAARAAISTMMRKFKPEDLPPMGRFHYHQGVFLSGVWENQLLDPSPALSGYVRAWCDSHILESGEITGFDVTQLDDVQPGILLFPFYAQSGQEKYRRALDTLAQTVMDFPRNPEGGLWHKHRYPNQMWLDGLYMAGPLCAQYAACFDKPEYLELTIDQALMMCDKTRDPKTGLLYHAYDQARVQPWADKLSGKSPEFWGRSMGWVGVAILNDLDFVPANHPKRALLEGEVKSLLNALLPFQGADGRWYQVVDKPDRPENWPENSCTCLYAAALCKAVRTGILDTSKLDAARRAYEGVISSLRFEGDDLLLGDVCVGTGVGDYTHYINRPTSVNDLHGMGAFLIMCAEAQRAGL